MHNQGLWGIPISYSDGQLSIIWLYLQVVYLGYVTKVRPGRDGNITGAMKMPFRACNWVCKKFQHK